MSSLENGEPKGFEGQLITALAKRAGYDLQIVPLASPEERIAALLDGRVDAVIHSFTVTAERSRLVQFIFPSYYSSGAAVFAPGGAIEGVSSWHDLSGKTLSAVEGNYVVDAAPETPALQNVTFVLAATIEEAAALVSAGEADGYLDDSSSLFSAPNLTIVSKLQPILRLPISIAVKLENDGLAQNLSKALLSLMEGGPNAPILSMEKETFVAAGAPPNPDLAALVANATPGNSTLYPAKDLECWPAPSDSIFLPADAYQAVQTWEVAGFTNYSCDAQTGDYKLIGWLMNGTDMQTGKHAGYAYTATGISGTHVPTHVATDASNSTVLGSVSVVREAGTADMPSPVNPATDVLWMRRAAHDQTGLFASPKVLFISRTDTQGGELPPATGPCKEGDPIISVPTTAVLTFYACRES